ncbi:MAG TPA: MMPL family transporter [Spongiibacteraceae bacterium]|jgi:predicted RND superfamily exporter protein|nr:MMPL family transporter [Spongiibacteraceae bacterium]HUH37829.1 MMPL family transporter [Spongiibacteraceae bacterium]
MFEVYRRLVFGRPWLTLLILMALCALAATQLGKLHLDASADTLVLEGDDALKFYREVSKRYESEDFLIVTYEPAGPLLADATLADIDSLRARLSKLDGVASVVTLLDVPMLFSPPVPSTDILAGNVPTLRDAEVDRELALKELVTSPIYRNLLVSPSGKVTAIQINLMRDEGYHRLLRARDRLRAVRLQRALSDVELAELDAVSKAFATYAEQMAQRQQVLVADVRAIIDDYRDNATLFLGGVPMIAADMIAFVKSDLVVFGTGMLLFIVLLLAIIFRRLIWILLPLATCGVTLLVVMGLFGFLDWKLTVISSNFVALLLIITLSITIHLVVRYRELASAEPDAQQYQLVYTTARSMIKPCIYTTLTTVAAFASFVVSGIRPVIDFGLMMTVGVMIALALTFVILPVGLLLMPRPAPVPTGVGVVALTVRFAGLVERFGNWILVAALALSGLAIWGISQLEVENRFIDYFHPDTEIYRGMEVIDAELGGTIPLEILLDGKRDEPSAAVSEADDFEDDFSDDFSDDFADDFDTGAGGATPADSWFNRAGLARIEAIHDYLEAMPETGKVLSLGTLYKVLRDINPDGVDDIQLALVQRSLTGQVKEVLMDPYLDAALDETRITLRVKETSRDLHRDELLHQIRSDLTARFGIEPERVHLTGMLVLYNNMLQSLYRSQILTMGFVFVAIMVMFGLLFRSISLALIAILPNLLAAGAVLGGMGLAGIPLDIMTVTIAAITVGIGVDDTIHYVHRFKREFPLSGNYLDTMYRCHGSIGKAMYYTSITIICGFSILVLSNFTPSIYFGVLTAVAMLAALMGALLLLPQLIVAFKPLGPEHEPQAVGRES